jgi:hypothetical protein
MFGRISRQTNGYVGGTLTVPSTGISFKLRENLTVEKLTDRLLLVGTALLLCLTGCGSFALGEIYHVNPAWLFFAWNSIFLIPIRWKTFRDYFRNPKFVLFFTVWMLVHGATVVGMMAWLPAVCWPLVVLLELGTGFAAAHWLFGFPLHQHSEENDSPVVNDS